MALTIKGTKRVFTFEDDNDETIELHDPAPELNVEEVKKFYSGRYPNITNGSISGPEMKNDKAYYLFSTKIGTKG